MLKLFEFRLSEDRKNYIKIIFIFKLSNNFKCLYLMDKEKITENKDFGTIN